ncbi:MAG TPA: Lrp/AsnC family transcriptional regulator [Solimonas sp.]|nr:Lrp/AsnC family transcriptional regulator [Solimonas sp.]
MDDTDKAILRLLQQDAKISIEKIGSAVGLSHTPVWKRIDRMEKAGIILGAHYRLNREALGLEITAFVSIKLSRHDEKALLEFERAVQDIPDVLDCYSMTGSYDYILRVVTASIGSYEAILKKKISRMPNIQDMYTSLALREVKHFGGLPL